MKNERTSKEIASIAGYILQWINGCDYANSGPVYAENLNGDLFLMGTKGKHVTVEDLRALAASALTQSPDKPKRKAKR